jgi:hypothetical protein
MKIIFHSKSLHLPKACGPTNENLTGCLQRYVFLGYEIMINDLSSNTKNSMLQIILMKRNFDFHRRTGGTWRTIGTRRDHPDLSMSCRLNNCPWSK